MVWDFVELNPFSSSNGNWKNACVEWVQKSIGALCPASKGIISQDDAQSLSFEKNHIISTDPPYYDNISYADLSDFFYIWMKKSLHDVYESLFKTFSTPKSEELIASSYRHGSKDEAETFFLEGMKRAIRNMAEQASLDYPATIYYAFKQKEITEEGLTSAGWATFLQAVIDAGYSIVGTWPMRTEKPGRMLSVGTNALANSVVLVCRKRPENAETITRAEFIRALKEELPEALQKLQQANIAPADLPQSAIGPGIGIFSRYAAVLEPDDTPMSVKTALELINAELDEYLSGLEGDFDAETRFAITWFSQFGHDEGDFGTANNIAQARATSVDTIEHAGIVHSRAGKVRLLDIDDLEEGWSPETDDHLTDWECCHYLIRALHEEGETGAARLLKLMGGERAEKARELAYRLYAICDDKGWAKLAQRYNALIAQWPELTALAAQMTDIDLYGDGQQSLL